MKIPDKLKGITGDFMYSMMGLIVMNGVIQLALYPFLSNFGLSGSILDSSHRIRRCHAQIVVTMSGYRNVIDS